MIITLLGINASGKDTIAKEIKEYFSSTIIVSESKLLMYSLKIIDNIDNRLVSTDDYKKLENAPRKEIDYAIRYELPSIIKLLNTRYDLVIILSHLVFALHIGKTKPVYLVDIDVPQIIIDLSNIIFQIKAPAIEIFDRRINDELKQNRKRPLVDVAEIEYHQKLCDEKWEVLKKNNPECEVLIVNNYNNKLNTAINVISNILINRNVRSNLE